LNSLSFDTDEAISVKANLAQPMLSARLCTACLGKHPDARGRNQNDFICAAKLDKLFDL